MKLRTRESTIVLSLLASLFVVITAAPSRVKAGPSLQEEQIKTDFSKVRRGPSAIFEKKKRAPDNRKTDTLINELIKQQRHQEKKEARESFRSQATPLDLSVSTDNLESNFRRPASDITDPPSDSGSRVGLKASTNPGVYGTSLQNMFYSPLKTDYSLSTVNDQESRTDAECSDCGTKQLMVDTDQPENLDQVASEALENELEGILAELKVYSEAIKSKDIDEISPDLLKDYTQQYETLMAEMTQEELDGLDAELLQEIQAATNDYWANQTKILQTMMEESEKAHSDAETHYQQAVSSSGTDTQQAASAQENQEMMVYMTSLQKRIQNLDKKIQQIGEIREVATSNDSIAKIDQAVKKMQADLQAALQAIEKTEEILPSGNTTTSLPPVLTKDQKIEKMLNEAEELADYFRTTLISGDILPEEFKAKAIELEKLTLDFEDIDNSGTIAALTRGELTDIRDLITKAESDLAEAIYRVAGKDLEEETEQKLADRLDFLTGEKKQELRFIEKILEIKKKNLDPSTSQTLADAKKDLEEKQEDYDTLVAKLEAKLEESEEEIADTDEEMEELESLRAMSKKKIKLFEEATQAIQQYQTASMQFEMQRQRLGLGMQPPGQMNWPSMTQMGQLPMWQISPWASQFSNQFSNQFSQMMAFDPVTRSLMGTTFQGNGMNMGLNGMNMGLNGMMDIAPFSPFGGARL